MLKAAASYEQRCGSIRPTQRKIPPNSKRVWGDSSFVHSKTVHQNTVFYLVGVSYLCSIKTEPMICEVSHKFIGSASMCLAL